MLTLVVQTLQWFPVHKQCFKHKFNYYADFCTGCRCQHNGPWNDMPLHVRGLLFFAYQAGTHMCDTHCWWRCAQCKHEGASLTAVLWHQQGSRTSWGRWTKNATRAGPGPCFEAGVDKVTVHRATGLHRPRVVVTCARPGKHVVEEDMVEDCHADMAHDELEYVQDQADAQETRLRRMREVMQPAFSGGHVPVVGGGMGGMPADDVLPEDAPSYHLQPAADRGAPTPSEATYTAFREQHKLTQRCSTDLLRMVRDPDFNPSELRFACSNTYDHALAERTAPGILQHSLHRAHVDGQNECMLWYRTAVQIVLDMVQDKELAQHITYAYRPCADPATGERVFSGIHDSLLLEAAYAYFDEPDVTVLLVMLACDGTCVEKRRGEHPYYVSLAQLSLQARRCDYAWRLAGCVPQYEKHLMRPDDEGAMPSQFEYNRRLAQLLREGAALILAGLQETGPEGVYVVLCGDGVVRRFRIIFGACTTDRQEQEVSEQRAMHCCWPLQGWLPVCGHGRTCASDCHVCVQTLNSAKKHSCFHCECEEWQRANREAVDAASRHTWTARRDTAMSAMTTGKYGKNEEWNTHIKHAAPIMKVRVVHGAAHITPQSMDRYEHCAIVTGVLPEHNALWNVSVLDFNQLCRDDELHQMRLGMMPHLLAAFMSKITESLHPPWAVEEGLCPGVSGMRLVWERLTKRLQGTGVNMTSFVAHSFVRAFYSRQQGCQFKFGLTAHETEGVFTTVAVCLPGLVQPELQILARARTRDRQRGVVMRVTDPIPDIIDLLCRFLAWYMCLKMQAHTASQVQLGNDCCCMPVYSYKCVIAPVYCKYDTPVSGIIILCAGIIQNIHHVASVLAHNRLVRCCEIIPV